MVLTIAGEEFLRMKMAVLDGDGKDALRILKEFVKRLDQQNKRGVKSHLD
jgi:hypothetical protein